MTVPGIGAVTVDCSGSGPCSCAASTSGTGRGGGAGRLSRQPPLHAGAGATGGGAESGGYSVRNAVVARPARTTGCATSQRRNGTFVVTPATLVSASAPANVSYASSRLAP